MATKTVTNPNSDDFMKKYGFGIIPVKRKKNENRDNLIVIYWLTGVTLIIAVLWTTQKSNVLVNGALTCITLIVKALVDRICCVYSEWSYKEGRYESRWKMIKACFSDIKRMKVVTCLSISFVVIYVCLYRMTDSKVTWEHVFQAFGGIGFGTLFYYVSKLDSQSVVERSINDEEMEKFVGHGLAWHYYCDYLQPVFEQLEDTINNSEWKDKLNSRKLFILFPLNCMVDRQPEKIDANNIKKLDILEIKEISGKKHYVRVYKICERNTVLLQFASPLKTLGIILGKCDQYKGVTEFEREEQVRLFYRTLEDILERFVKYTSPEKRWHLVPFNFVALKSQQDNTNVWSGLGKFLEKVVLPPTVETPLHHDLSTHDVAVDILPDE